MLLDKDEPQFTNCSIHNPGERGKKINLGPTGRSFSVELIKFIQHIFSHVITTCRELRLTVISCRGSLTWTREWAHAAGTSCGGNEKVVHVLNALRTGEVVGTRKMVGGRESEILVPVDFIHFLGVSIENKALCFIESLPCHYW